MDAAMILSVLSAVDALCPAGTRDSLLSAARITRPPNPGETVREDLVSLLHKAVRTELPAEEAGRVLDLAGQKVGDHVLAHEITKRAQTLLKRAPWHLSVWLLGRAAEQNTWAIFGSGTFDVERNMGFELRNTPLIRGEEAQAPICHFHVGLFSRLLTELADPNLTCREIACQAMGHDACRFAIGTTSGSGS